MGTLYGDLTRIGQVSEQDFGWQKPQPAIAADLLRNFSLTEADVVVIGDSFSNGLVWQSRLVAAGFKPATLKWDLFEPCSMGENLADILRIAGFKGYYVVIENVEHGFQSRMETTCKLDLLPDNTRFSVLPPPVLPPVSHGLFNKKEPLGGDWIIHALINQFRLDYLFDASQGYLDTRKSGDHARIVTIEGCTWFSHRLCNYGLFYSHDFDKRTFESASSILKVDANLKKNGMDAIWIAVPDKATVYLGYGNLSEHPYVNVWKALSQYPQLNVPDLATLFIKQSRLTKDFYKPNDVHLSNEGYFFMGDYILDFMNNITTLKPN